jgi:hypothetical protein
MGLKPGRIYWRWRCRHHLSAAPPNLHPKTRKWSPPVRPTGARSTLPPWPECHRLDADRQRRWEVYGNRRDRLLSGVLLDNALR